MNAKKNKRIRIWVFAGHVKIEKVGGTFQQFWRNVTDTTELAEEKGNKRIGLKDNVLKRRIVESGEWDGQREKWKEIGIGFENIAKPKKNVTAALEKGG
jgi:hypothetical protein